MPRKSSSNVWNCFIKISGGGKCKLCGKEIKTSGNTNNLANHIRKHNGLALASKISKESIGGTRNSSDPSVAETPKMNEDEDEEIDFSKNEDFNEKDGASSILSERSATPTSGVSSLSFANATFTQKRIDDTFAEIGS
ncbi:unnamed protein product [Psylliodes chrysocephalus]|uniref:BED-type domain-containing protein n=1 Tax=Psylliodes chrysocephalus TaxID=3402493 RepID=A0A9P0G2A7_9CUCU|nr:unnamed protein product [Psylliodes chrysocephala]